MYKLSPFLFSHRVCLTQFKLLHPPPRMAIAITRVRAWCFRVQGATWRYWKGIRACLLFRWPSRQKQICTFMSLVAEIVEIELDVLRNNILRFELLLSISAFMVTLGALVTGKLDVLLLMHYG